MVCDGSGRLSGERRANGRSPIIVGILLAAGASRRFGAPKLLQTLAGGIPVALAAARALQSGTDECVAVVRPEDEQLARLFVEHRVPVVSCPSAAGGMGYSIACGIRRHRTAHGWIIALADMPFVRQKTIAGVADLLRNGASLAAPVHGGRIGQPVGFGQPFGEALCGLQGDHGARGILESHREALCLYPCDDPGIHWDIDTPADLLRHDSTLRDPDPGQGI